MLIRTFATAGSSRQNNFDFIRFALAMAVLVCHACTLARGSDEVDPLYHLTGGREHTGALAVAGFFVISGFLIAHSWTRCRGLLDFLRRRAVRIYPGFVVALALTVFVVGARCQPHYAAAAAAKEFGRALLTATQPYLPGIFSTNPKPDQANGSLWTIRYELLCYLTVAAFGLTGLLARRRAVLTAFGLSMLVYAVAERLDVHGSPWGRLVFTGPFHWTAAPRLFTCFFAGTTFWAYRDRIPDSPWLALACLTGLALSPRGGDFAVHMTVPVFFTYGLFWLAFRPGVPLQQFGRWGDFSYGTYLYAFPVSQLLIRHGGGHFSGSVIALGTAVITLPIAAGSWYLAERPLLRWKRKRSDPVGVESDGVAPHGEVTLAATRAFARPAGRGGDNVSREGATGRVC